MSDVFAGEGRKHLKGTRWKGMHTLHPVLTDHQVQIARLLGQGYANKEVGTLLHVSTNTAETHRANIYRLTNSHNACQLLIWLCREKLLDIEDLPDMVSPANPLASK